MCQNRVPLVNIKIAGKWMFIPLKMVLIGIDPYPTWGKVGSLIQGPGTQTEKLLLRSQRLHAMAAMVKQVYRVFGIA